VGVEQSYRLGEKLLGWKALAELAGGLDDMVMDGKRREDTYRS